MNHLFFTDYFESISRCVSSVDMYKLEKINSLVENIKINSKKIIIAGNGGSAAIASHVAVDFSKAANIRSINFNEADLITCLANDYGYENWISKALNFYADPGDLVFLVSSSGKSPNIINGAQTAREMGLGVVTLSGFSRDNPLRELGNIELWANSTNYNIVEMTHHIWLLAIVDYIIERQY